MSDGPSETARRVAAHRLAFARAPWSTGDADADDRLQADVAAVAPVDRTSRMARYLDRRTRFFDAAVVDGLTAGCEQVVVLGCGYDGRSLRYRAGGVRWFELDQPATIADRASRLERLGIDTTGATPVAVDFERDNLRNALAAAGLAPGRPTLFLCEGVTPYLTDGTVRRLLSDAVTLGGSDGRLAVDFALQPESAEDADARRHLAARVSAVGEAFRWTPDRNEIVPLLESAGWSIETAVDPAGVALPESRARTVFVLACS